jgi:hypothetical protein
VDRTARRLLAIVGLRNGGPPDEKEQNRRDEWMVIHMRSPRFDGPKGSVLHGTSLIGAERARRSAHVAASIKALSLPVYVCVPKLYKLGV